MQKVLVTGATGFIGIEVPRHLANFGMRPRLMVRRPVRGLMMIPSRFIGCRPISTDFKSASRKLYL